ncbi:MAG: hypothetical protein AAED33_14925 [Paracoccaceae bacterium]
MVTRIEDLRIGFDVAKDLPWGMGKRNQQKVSLLSRNILDDDLGLFDDSVCYDYDLDKTTRDRLIAHAGQDAANSLLMATDAFTMARNARLWGWFNFILLVIICFKVW